MCVVIPPDATCVLKQTSAAAVSDPHHDGSVCWEPPGLVWEWRSRPSVVTWNQINTKSVVTWNQINTKTQQADGATDAFGSTLILLGYVVLSSGGVDECNFFEEEEEQEKLHSPTAVENTSCHSVRYMTYSRGDQTCVAICGK